MKPPRQLNPWYVIIWRIPWFMLYHIAIFVAAIAICLANGIDRAITFWKSNV